MTAKELREAAERILTSCSTRFGEGVFSLASHILATVQEDGDEPVTSEWLREEWGWTYRDGAYCYGRFRMCSSANGNGKWMLMWDTGNTWPRTITTRSQFRSLMKGLGIEPQKISEKR